MSDAGASPWFAAVLDLAALRVEQARARWSACRGPSSLHDYVDEVLAAAARAHPRAPEEVTARLAADPRLGRLASALGLGLRELEWVALLAAVQLEPRLCRLLAYLDDDSVPEEPAPSVAAGFWGWPDGWWPGPGSATARWGLASPTRADGGDPRSSWQLAADVSAFLAGREDWWAESGGLSVYLPAEVGSAASPGVPLDCLYPDVLSAARAATGRLTTGSLVLEVVGPPGSGRRTLLRQLCRDIGRHAVVVARGLPWARSLRTAVLEGAVVLEELGVGEAEPPVDDRPGALTLFARSVPGDGPPTPAGLGRPPARPVRVSFRLPYLDRSHRLRLWHASSATPVPRVVADWTLTPGQIAAAVAGAPLGAAAVTAALRQRLDGLPAPLLTAVPSVYGWDDLIVADDVGAQLLALESQVRLRSEVLDDWGMGRLTPQSRGTAALFAGPSGTGKTMAAQILARSLELDLYRVDLAQVVNKYIGETEKRLSDLFDQCEHSNVMVLFDEADALFGQRTRVRDAHDRFANIEIDYLLQRIESFNGVAVLATNRKSDLDPGFLRRLRLIVDFRPPTTDERRRLWDLALPSLRPDGDLLTGELDLDWLAGNIELTGAEIKSVSLNAAYAARAAGRPIEQHDLLAAARLELAKHGTVLRTERHHRAVAAR